MPVCSSRPLKISAILRDDVYCLLACPDFTDDMPITCEPSTAREEVWASDNSEKIAASRHGKAALKFKLAAEFSLGVLSTVRQEGSQHFVVQLPPLDRVEFLVINEQ